MKRVTIILLFIFLFKIGSANKIEVIYPNRDGMGEKAFGYQLLVMVLKKAGKITM